MHSSTRVRCVKIRGYSCFNEWAGLDDIKPINVIIGRNNAGKSHFLDLAEALCSDPPSDNGWQWRWQGTIHDNNLRVQFPDRALGGDLPGNYWNYHGKHFSGQELVWMTSDQGQVTDIIVPPHIQASEDVSDARKRNLMNAARGARHVLYGYRFHRLQAERDIRREPHEISLILARDGRGATNIIRAYQHSTNANYRRELISEDVLRALNDICASTGNFTEITARNHENVKTDSQASSSSSEIYPNGDWEIYLNERRKGLVPLSKSGSGLKTVLLVLLNLLVVPHLLHEEKNRIVFAFEELENNLHPALFRRLLRYLEKYIQTEKATLFITTHSSVALDFFGSSKEAQIIHVKHNGKSASTHAVSAHFDQLGVLSELGAKPSDLLQANGIIWVEGPSDRIYVNRWLELFSEGELREGRDYQCAFYGGSLLAQVEARSREEADGELMNLLCINPNIVVICDGDRPSEDSELKPRVDRLKIEVEKIPRAHIWITKAREIENYLPGSVLGKVFDRTAVPDPGCFDDFFPSTSKTATAQSFLETKLDRRSVQKVELAISAVPHMSTELLASRFDLGDQIRTIIATIRQWDCNDTAVPDAPTAVPATQLA